jgi:phage-related tail protein
MSNDVKLQVLLKAVDQATRPFKSIQTASKTLSGDIRDTQKSLRELNGQASRIDGFRKASAQLAVTGQALKKAKQEAAALAIQFKNTEQPTRAQAQAMDAARKAPQRSSSNTTACGRRYNASAGAQPGGNQYPHPGGRRAPVKTSISETTAQLNRQREALARVSAQQAKLNAVKQRYQAGKEMAGKMAGAGAAGVGIATAGTMAGVKLMVPGYDFSLKTLNCRRCSGSISSHQKCRRYANRPDSWG